MSTKHLGIERVHSIEVCVHDAAPWLAYLGTGFGFQLIAVSTGQEVERTGTRKRLLRCGDVILVLAERVHEGSSVRRYLERHPEGLASVSFLVRDLQATEEHLLESHATPLGFTETHMLGDTQWKELSIATPLGDVQFTFIECSDQECLLMPGMESDGQFDATQNPLGLVGFDHMTANMRTLMPTLAFFEHVMGFKRFWDVQFHTEDIRPGIGTGLKSVVMWDAQSGIKIANNEPLRPRFDDSQIQVCVELNRGPGVHHIAFQVDDIVAAVDHCRSHDVEFLATPRAYYRALPGRITAQGIAKVTHELGDLEERGILLDGDKKGHLLQAFCRDQAAQFDRASAGPMFLELVQRCGARGFGEGNFRALFEAMQRQQEDVCGEEPNRPFADS